MCLSRYARAVPRYDRLPADIERAIVAVLEGEIDLQRRLENEKRSLAAMYDYNANSAYQSVDRPYIGRIDSVSLG